MNIISTSEKIDIEKVFVGTFFPCDENCEQIDLVIDDNGSIENYTKEKGFSNDYKYVNAIQLNKGEITMFDTGEFLDFYKK